MTNILDSLEDLWAGQINFLSEVMYCNVIERALGFELCKGICKKTFSLYNEHIMYMTNQIYKPFKTRIIFYYEHIHDIFELEICLNPPRNNTEELFDA